MKPEMKSPGTNRVKLKCGILLSTSAFKFNLRRCSMADDELRMLALAYRDAERVTTPSTLN
jgi:hypothetical protein